MMRRFVALVAVAAMAVSCSSRAATDSASASAVPSNETPRSVAPEREVAPCWADETGQSPVGSAKTFTIGPEFELVIPRVNYDDTVLASDSIVYEANNTDMRGPKVADRYQVTGAEVAARWGQVAAAVNQVFVLRDSLFSQPDHPFLQPEACSLMLAPNWITVAAHHHDPIPPTTPDLDNDSAWAALAGDPSAVFGSFPSSSRMHALATSPLGGPDEELTRNSRANLIMLATWADRLLAKRADGVDAVLSEGAAIVSEGDLRYFGPELRRDSFIPILVANPGAAELAEGKGAAVAGLSVAESELDALMVAVLRRRLLDGDVAVERYDLSTERDQLRAVAILEAIIPSNEPAGATVWLWVNGRLDPDQKLRGEGPLAYMDEFNARLEAANVARSRLRYVAKPVVDLPAVDQRTSLAEAVRAGQEFDMPVSVTLDANGLQSVLTN